MARDDAQTTTTPPPAPPPASAVHAPRPHAADRAFGLSMGTILKGFGVLAVIAVVVITMKSQGEEAAAEAWSAYGRAHRDGFTIESLERAYAETSGSAAEPWVAFRLALALWEDGTPESLARAEQVASEATSRFGGHPAHASLTTLLDAIRELRAFEA